jgi:hypothetical protein
LLKLLIIFTEKNLKEKRMDAGVFIKMLLVNGSLESRKWTEVLLAWIQVWWPGSIEGNRSVIVGWKKEDPKLSLHFLI